MVEAYNERKFWRLVEEKTGAEHFVVGSRHGCAAGARTFVSNAIREAFETVWRIANWLEEGDVAVARDELEVACEAEGVPFYKSWHAPERALD